MMTFLLSAPWLLLILTTSGAVPPLPHTLDCSYTFEEFVKDFSKTYEDEERGQRKAIFESNLHHILEHNKKDNHGHVSGVNHFMDIESHELPMGYDKSFHEAWQGNGVSEVLKNHQMDIPFDIDEVSTLPKSVDWRANGVVTPVKNQGMCGSCWAFASTAVLESHIAIRTGVLFTLSVQQLVSCVPNPRNCGGEGGCSGATGYLAMDFVASQGIVDEWQLGYQSYGGDSPNCTLENSTFPSLRGNVGLPSIGRPRATIEGYAIMPPNDYKATMNALAKMGPLVVAVSCNNWHFYTRGVFTDEDKSPRAFDINHAVVLTGYGTDEETGEDYWLIRNSWGPTWGENGYIRLKRVDPETLDDPDTDCGMDATPKHGESCTKDEDGNPITPPAVKVCGTNGILFDPVLPIGGRLMQRGH